MGKDAQSKMVIVFVVFVFLATSLRAQSVVNQDEAFRLMAFRKDSLVDVRELPNGDIEFKYRLPWEFEFQPDPDVIVETKPGSYEVKWRDIRVRIIGTETFLPRPPGASPNATPLVFSPEGEQISLPEWRCGINCGASMPHLGVYVGVENATSAIILRPLRSMSHADIGVPCGYRGHFEAKTSPYRKGTYCLDFRMLDIRRQPVIVEVDMYAGKCRTYTLPLKEGAKAQVDHNIIWLVKTTPKPIGSQNWEFRQDGTRICTVKQATELKWNYRGPTFILGFLIPFSEERYRIYAHLKNGCEYLLHGGGGPVIRPYNSCFIGRADQVDHIVIEEYPTLVRFRFYLPGIQGFPLPDRTKPVLEQIELPYVRFKSFHEMKQLVEMMTGRELVWDENVARPVVMTEKEFTHATARDVLYAVIEKRDVDVHVGRDKIVVRPVFWERVQRRMKNGWNKIRKHILP